MRFAPATDGTPVSADAGIDLCHHLHARGSPLRRPLRPARRVRPSRAWSRWPAVCPPESDDHNDAFLTQKRLRVRLKGEDELWVHQNLLTHRIGGQVGHVGL